MRFGRAIPVLTALAFGFCGGWPGGIQAVLRYRASEHALFIDSVASGGAAEHAGLQPHDRILAIDGAPVDAMSEAQIRERLHGEVGSHVRLHVDRDGTEMDLVVERAPYRNAGRR